MNLLAVAGIGALVLAASGFFARRTLQRRSVRTKALARANWGDHRGAARFYEEAGDRLEAARSYAQAGEALKAIELFQAHGDAASAQAAVLKSAPDQLAAAIALVRKASPPPPAPELSGFARRALELGDHALAAELFKESGDAAGAREASLGLARKLVETEPAKAADLFEQHGDAKLAAAALVRAIARASGEQKVSLSRRASGLLMAQGDRLGSARLLAASGDVEGGVKLLLDGGDTLQAAALLQSAGQSAKAAELLEKAGALKQAAAVWASSGEVRRAAAILEKLGDAPSAAKLLVQAKDSLAAAQILLRAGARAAAVEVLVRAGEVERALKLQLEADDVDGAVELLVKLKRPRDAAALLEKKGDHHRAAVLLAEAGDLGKRAQLLEGKGDFEGAAQAYLDLGRPGDALDCLGNVTALTPSGRFLSARASMATKDFLAASQHFAALLEGALPPRVTRDDVLYGLARSFEELGRTREALATLGEILGHAPNYRDAPFRQKLLLARLAEEEKKARAEAPPAAPKESWVAQPQAASAAPEMPAEWGGGEVVSAVDSLNAWASEALSTAPPPVESAVRAAAVADTVVPHKETLPARYAVERELGRGGMGVVYRAVDAQLGRTVALKVLDSRAGADPRVRDYFLREARAVAQLVHPNIVTLFDAGLEGSSPWLVMEFIDGQDLRGLLSAGPLGLPDTVRILGAVAEALEYAHGRRIVHRDVKPENILVGADGVAKLMDFGIAHVLQENTERKATVVGTPIYMSPEQIKGDPVGAWTDTYSLGVVLFECLSGGLPFDPAGALYHHVNTPAPDFRQIRPDLPPGIAELVNACLAKDPAQRPQSTKEISLRLASAVKAA